MTDISDGSIRVVAAVADKKKVILYKEDGDTVTVSQGDFRLQALMDEIIPITARGEVAVISLTNFSAYADFQKQSEGVVRFYKTRRNALGSLAGNLRPTQELAVVNIEFSTDISPLQMTELMDQVQEYVAPWINQTSASKPINAKISVAVTEDQKVTEEVVTARLEPIDESFDETTSDSIDVIVAVIGDTIIPDVEKLRPYIVHAVKNNSVPAVAAFLKRLAAMISTRGHSIKELMHFLQHADLPIAEDGTLLAYKVLAKKGSCYVDPHTQQVKQNVGSLVQMDESIMDLNRRTECSVGLHVARRAYLRNFTATDAFLIRVNPEDIVAVPLGEANKMRVSQYHIIQHLPDEAYKLLKSNEPMTSNEHVAKMLAHAIKGHHPGVIETVTISGPNGTNITYAKAGETPKKAKDKTPVKAAVTIDSVKDDKKDAPHINPRDMNKKISEAMVEETKAQRDARKKREKRAAEKAAKLAAQAPAAVVEPQDTASSDLTAEQKRVLGLIAAGVSQSETSRQTGVPRRTIGRWVEKYGTKTQA